MLAQAKAEESSPQSMGSKVAAPRVVENPSLLIGVVFQKVLVAVTGQTHVMEKLPTSTVAPSVHLVSGPVIPSVADPSTKESLGEGISTSYESNTQLATRFLQIRLSFSS